MTTRYTVRDNGGVRAGYAVRTTRVAGEFATALVSVTRAAGAVRRGDLVGVVVFGCRRRVHRRGGVVTRLGYNGVVLLKKDGAPAATRVYAPVYLEARHAGYARLAVVAAGVL